MVVAVYVSVLSLFTFDLCTVLYSLQNSFVYAILFVPVGWELGRYYSPHLIDEETEVQRDPQDMLAGGRSGTCLTPGRVPFLLARTSSFKYNRQVRLPSHRVGESLQEALH